MGFDIIKPAFHRDPSHSKPSTPQDFECIKECSLYLRLLLDDPHVSRSKLVILRLRKLETFSAKLSLIPAKRAQI